MVKQAKFHGLDMIHVYLDLTGGQLQDSIKLLELFEACQNRPYVLDDEIIGRTIQQYEEKKR